MRSEAEKKSIVKSIKLSPSQVQQIEEKANEKNMTFSSYMVDCALHNNQGINIFLCKSNFVHKRNKCINDFLIFRRMT